MKRFVHFERYRYLVFSVFYEEVRMSGDELLQFVPFTSTLDTGFWYQLSQRKLHIYKLDVSPVKIHGFYTNREDVGLPALANIDYTAFDDNHETPPRCLPLVGYLLNTNTVEDFKKLDKNGLSQEAGKDIWNAIISKGAIEDPSKLSRLMCITFADLKKYNFYYWFSFPALCYPEDSVLLNSPKKFQDYFSENEITQLQNGYDSLQNSADKAYFLIFISSEDKILSVVPLREYSSLQHKPGKILLGFADPSTLQGYPGWPLRNFLSLVAYHWSQERKHWEILCFRDRIKEGIRSSANSIIIEVLFKNTEIPLDCPQSVGWEKNIQNKFGPRMVDLSSTMNPTKLSESAVDLNLKLMRWRLIPELDLDKISSIKCLLLGAGTLGCNVARCLLGWGVKTITFVDNAQVSYSNPVRQTLFTFEDCLNGGKPKALAAANALKSIFPSINSSGINLTIPMPGHPVTEKLLDQTRCDVKQLQDAIEEHDVIFLLLDTRESRWLPTVIGAQKKKLVINAALGFDTFLVVRHGTKVDMTVSSSASSMGQNIPGSQLGCYFCNDVVAPGDSTKDRTVDQQCTVTRPGVSMLAAALAVELMVSIIQHPEGYEAPATTSARDDHLSVELASPLGIVPHQIRGFLSRYHCILPATKAFDNCIACSSPVLESYQHDGFEFLLKVFNESNYLEDLTGLKKLLMKTNMDEIWELSDDENS